MFRKVNAYTQWGKLKRCVVGNAVVRRDDHAGVRDGAEAVRVDQDGGGSDPAKDIWSCSRRHQCN